MRPISVIITTFNEAHHIDALLNNVKWADEVIVVDSFSSDETVDIANQHGVRVLKRIYDGPAAQKNWAIPQAKHEWILLLDADERVTTDLQHEIQEWLQKETISFDAFWIGRRNFFMGEEIRYSGWQGDQVVRFFHRDRCRYNDKQVHEEIITEGIKVSQLKQKMLHYTFKDTSHFLAKMERYASWSAQDYAAKTPRVTYFHLWIKPFFRFVKHFILQSGFRDGKPGFIVSIIMAWGVFLRYVRLLEMKGER